MLSLVLLKPIVSGHLTGFVTRTKRIFWKVPPSKALFAALISTMIVDYMMVAIGVGIILIGNGLAAFVQAYSCAWFLLEDILRIGFERVTLACPLQAGGRLTS